MARHLQVWRAGLEMCSYVLGMPILFFNYVSVMLYKLQNARDLYCFHHFDVCY